MRSVLFVEELLKNQSRSIKMDLNIASLMPKNENETKLKCPFKLANSRYCECACEEQKCAWYDNDLHECAVLTLALKR